MQLAPQTLKELITLLKIDDSQELERLKRYLLKNGSLEKRHAKSMKRNTKGTIFVVVAHRLRNCNSLESESTQVQALLT